MDVQKFTPKERVIAYIDGYNLYFGLKDSGFKRFLWLNIQSLIESLLTGNQELVKVKYFTTLVTNDVAKRLRQKQFISALQSLDKVEIFYGKFQKEKNHCGVCGNDYPNDCEKMTDVGIATQVVKDYYTDAFDMAMIVSGDTDLLPPIRLINESADNKRVFVAFPPDRSNDEVRKFAKGSMVIGRKNLLRSQFDDKVTNVNGEVFNRPVEWK
ncbi:MAG TPA: NYN domain-containing protein [Chitinophagaceae bacterium]|nr:NYN domain-containing protein [Chitinophagaceae bacterium]